MSHPNDDNPQAVLDFQRADRTGLAEAVFCAHKSPRQIADILERFEARTQPCLMTRLDSAKHGQLSEAWRGRLDFDALSRTAIFGDPAPEPRPFEVAVVSGGTSDAPVCAEAARTLAYYGVNSRQFQDVGVTGLWRVLKRLQEIRTFSIVIVVAGMEGALFSVLGGLLDAVLIALPTSVSYGVGADGELALHAALGSCAPGILTVNIDNGYGAACAAIRVMNQMEAATRRSETLSTAP